MVSILQNGFQFSVVIIASVLILIPAILIITEFD